MTNRSGQCEQLIVESVKEEAEKLFRILLLTVLYTLGQHGSLSDSNKMALRCTGTYQQVFELPLLLHHIIQIRRFQ